VKIGYLLQLGEEIRRPPFNGPANHIRQVFLRLGERGHQLVLIFRLEDRLWITGDMREFKPVAPGKNDRGIRRILERGLRRLQTLFKLPYLGFFESRRFADACRREIPDCDLYYERFAWMTYGGLMAARRAGVPWVAEYNGDPLDDLEAKQMAPSGLQKRISKAITRRTLHHAARLVATGQGWARNCVERWGVPEARVSVVENGTDLLDMLDRDALRSFRTPTPADDETRIVYLGGFYAWHGVDKLLGALAVLVGRDLPVRLNLIGSGSGEAEARQRMSDLGLDRFVTFTGRLKAEEYAPHLAGSDIGVSPYCGWREYSGLKIFDYKAAGLACVASGEKGQPATLCHMKTGWIVPPCDQDALADALFTLAGDRELRRRLGRAARVDAERHNAWRHTAEQLEDIFREVREN